jgi:hypothetical protein
MLECVRKASSNTTNMITPTATIPRGDRTRRIISSSILLGERWAVAAAAMCVCMYVYVCMYTKSLLEYKFVPIRSYRYVCVAYRIAGLLLRLEYMPVKVRMYVYIYVCMWTHTLIYVGSTCHTYMLNVNTHSASVCYIYIVQVYIIHVYSASV